MEIKSCGQAIFAKMLFTKCKSWLGILAKEQNLIWVLLRVWQGRIPSKSRPLTHRKNVG
jgi:hypothetical protein